MRYQVTITEQAKADIRVMYCGRDLDAQLEMYR